MKYLLFSSFLAFSITALCQEYQTIDSGTFPIEKRMITAESMLMEKEEAPINGGSRIGIDEMNSAPNPAPETQGDILEDTTLTGPFGKKPDEIEAQEEDALDYSTTPQKRRTKPLGPNKN